MPAVVDLAAMRDGIKALGGDPQKINPLNPVDLVIDHSVMVDEFGTPARLPAQRRPRVRAQHRALPVPEVGAERLRQLPGGAAGHRHLPPGQPRVPGADGVDRQGPVGRARRLSRHAGRHRQPHHDGQRPGGARLGRRRHRGRGGDARPAGVDADPRGGRLQADRQDDGRHDRDRPRAQGRADAAQEGRGRASSSSSTATGLDHLPLADRATIANMAPEYGATCGFFPIDDETLRYLRNTGRDEDADRAGRGLRQGERHVARAGLRPGLYRHAASRHGRDRPGDLRPEAAAGLHAAHPRGGRLLQDRRRLPRHRHLERRREDGGRGGGAIAGAARGAARPQRSRARTTPSATARW